MHLSFMHTKINPLFFLFSVSQSVACFWALYVKIDSTALSAAYLRLDGSNSPTADIDFGGFDVENLPVWRHSAQQQIVSTSATDTTLLIKNTSVAENIQHHVEVEGSLTFTQVTGLSPAPDLSLTFKRSGGAGNKSFKWDETNDRFVLDDDVEVDSEIRFTNSTHNGLIVKTGAAAFTAADATNAKMKFTNTNSGQVEMTDTGGTVRWNVIAATSGGKQGFMGLDVATPLSKLDVDGSVGFAIKTVTANYTVTDHDCAVDGDATSGNITITLLAAANCTRRMKYFKKLDSSSNTVTVKANGSELIDGSNTIVLSTQNQGITLHCTGSGWRVR